MRIAPGTSPAGLCATSRPACAHTPYGAQVTFSEEDLGEPFAIDATGPEYDAARLEP